MLNILPQLEAVARRCVWFEEPKRALKNPARFIAYVLTYGTAQDVMKLRAAISDEALREALQHAPPGIYDARSWHYWHLMLGLSPTPPMPQRFAEATFMDED